MSGENATIHCEGGSGFGALRSTDDKIDMVIHTAIRIDEGVETK